ETHGAPALSCTRSTLAPDAPRGLVRAQSKERRVSQMTLGGPLDEADLRGERRLHPAHFFHLLWRHAAAPVCRASGRQIGKRTSIRLERLEMRGDVAAQMRSESGADLRGEAQHASRAAGWRGLSRAIVVADDERVDAVGARAVSADDELLLLVEFQ